MRKSRQETEETRKRIVNTASETFRKSGIAESGLKELMQGAGLETPGGFYKHFGSKEELVTEAISFSISEASGPSFRGLHFLGSRQRTKAFR
jgi:TetR/AcrR family transcriptional repressor of nem operon